VPAHPPESAAQPAVDCEKRFVACFVRDEDGGPLPSGQLHALYGEGFVSTGLYPGDTWGRLDAQGLGQICLA
jgi:hypothetical protein